MAPLLPKLRGHFAEFLNHSSPERLSILNQTTCVGFRYGPCTHIARGFSRQHRHIKHPQQTGYASRLTHKCRTDLPILRATRLHHNPISGLDYQSVSPHRLATNDQDPTHHTPTNTQRVNINGGGWLVQPSHHLSRIHGYGTINPLSIDYACRPRLRSRLTLGRLASPRNP